MMREKDDCREEKKMGFIYLGSLPLLRSHNHNGEGKYRKEIPSSICSLRSNAGNRKRKKEREKEREVLICWNLTPNCFHSLSVDICGVFSLFA